MTHKIQSAIYNKGATKLVDLPTTYLKEFVMIGRSNVGKSTLINAMCQKKELAKTSSKPGKTQLINFFDIHSNVDGVGKERYLVDLPGYGYAKSSQASRMGRASMISDYISSRKAIRQIYVLIDSRLSPQQIDLMFVEWLHDISISFTLVFTKTDQVTQKDLHKNIKNFVTKIYDITEYAPKYLTLSAYKKTGIPALLDDIGSML